MNQTRRLRRQLRKVLYALQRAYATPLHYCVPGTQVPDFDTGEQVVTIVSQYIRKAIVFDLSIAQKFEYDLSFIAANKNFTYGGYFELGDRIIVLSSQDVAARPQTDNYVVLDGARYSFFKIEPLVADAGWLLVCRTVQKATGPVTIEKHMRDVLTVTQTITGTL